MTSKKFHHLFYHDQGVLIYIIYIDIFNVLVKTIRDYYNIFALKYIYVSNMTKDRRDLQ